MDIQTQVYHSRYKIREASLNWKYFAKAEDSAYYL
uniref:Uncharacterized protein n=1 Tax=Anguilla anguilla TaxID=7936 RepID=A0A0E9UI41_ANGAN